MKQRAIKITDQMKEMQIEMQTLQLKKADYSEAKYEEKSGAIKKKYEDVEKERIALVQEARGVQQKIEKFSKPANALTLRAMKAAKDQGPGDQMAIQMIQGAHDLDVLSIALDNARQNPFIISAIRQRALTLKDVEPREIEQFTRQIDDSVKPLDEVKQWQNDVSSVIQMEFLHEQMNPNPTKRVNLGRGLV